MSLVARFTPHPMAKGVPQTGKKLKSPIGKGFRYYGIRLAAAVLRLKRMVWGGILHLFPRGEAVEKRQKAKEKRQKAKAQRSLTLR